MIRSDICGVFRAARSLENETRAVLQRGDDYRGAGKSVCDWEDEAAQERLINELARDGLAVSTLVEGRDVDKPMIDGMCSPGPVEGTRQPSNRRYSSAPGSGNRTSPDELFASRQSGSLSGFRELSLAVSSRGNCKWGNFVPALLPSSSNHWGLELPLLFEVIQCLLGSFNRRRGVDGAKIGADRLAIFPRQWSISPSSARLTNAPVNCLRSHSGPVNPPPSFNSSS